MPNELVFKDNDKKFLTIFGHWSMIMSKRAFWKFVEKYFYQELRKVDIAIENHIRGKGRGTSIDI